MFHRPNVRTLWILAAVIVGGALIGWLAFGGSIALADPQAGSTPAQSDPIGSFSGSDNPDATWFSCTPQSVAAFPERIHIRCSNTAPGGIRYFALSTSNSPHAARILSLLSIGQVTGSTLSILYEPGDLSGAAIGCQVSDCRLILAAELL